MIPKVYWQTAVYRLYSLYVSLNLLISNSQWQQMHSWPYQIIKWRHFLKYFNVPFLCFDIETYFFFKTGFLWYTWPSWNSLRPGWSRTHNAWLCFQVLKLKACTPHYPVQHTIFIIIFMQIFIIRLQLPTET